VSFAFNGSGARKFGDATARNIGKRSPSSSTAR
jgi:preprotein translocase subunit SecD